MRNTCVFCGGSMRSKRVTVLKEHGGKVIIIERVPAGVCTQCGEREYEAKVAAKLELILKEHRAVQREKLVPVANFALA